VSDVDEASPDAAAPADDLEAAATDPSLHQQAAEADTALIDPPLTGAVLSGTVEIDNLEIDGAISESVMTEPEAGEHAVTDMVEAPEPPAREDGAPGEPALEETETDEPLGFNLPPPMSQMLFVDVVLVLPSTHPVVVLQEADFPYRELRIPIGGPEGIAIGYASRRVPTPRPLTHELMTQLMENFGLTLDVVRITGLQSGMFTAEITVSGPGGQRVLDCRPSDAIALALRQQMRVPIMADPDVLDRAAGAAAGQN